MRLIFRLNAWTLTCRLKKHSFHFSPMLDCFLKIQFWFDTSFCKIFPYRRKDPRLYCWAMHCCEAMIVLSPYKSLLSKSFTITNLFLASWILDSTIWNLIPCFKHFFVHCAGLNWPGLSHGDWNSLLDIQSVSIM